MFKVKRKDGYPLELDVYSVRELSDYKPEYELQFLVFHNEEWVWLYAKDWVPI